MRFRSLVLLGILLLLSLTLAAQSHRESVTVEVVDVPVYVLRGGAPVDGLTRENFELYVNGRLQPIEYFDSLATAEGATLRERRLVLLLFDVAFTHPFSLGRAQRAAGRMIANAQPGDYFAVVTYSNRRGVWFAAPFTRDREALLRAVASLNNTRSGDPLSIVITAAERASLHDWAGADWSNGSFDPANIPARMSAETLGDLIRARTLRAAEDQVLGLTELSERLAPLDGEKHVVVLSEGYDGRTPNPSDLRRLSARPPYTPDGYASSSSRLFASAFDPILTTRIQDMHRTFQRSNVLLHALDLEGVGNTLMTNDSLNWLTSGTGGKFVHGTNDLGGALMKLGDTLSRGYRLGFRPTDARSGHNRIEVKVRDAGRGLIVHHRQGFSDVAERANVVDGLYLADVVLNDVPQSGTAASLELRGGKLAARIPMSEVAAQLPRGGNAELLIYAFAADGSALAYHRAVVSVSADASGEKTIEINLPEGTKVAKALLRVDGSLGFSKVTS